MVRLTYFIILLCNFCYAQLFETKINCDHIRIDQAGPGDIMLEPIILTLEEVMLRFPESPVKINKNVFDSVCRYINKVSREKPEKLLRKVDVNEFGVFKVTIQTEGKNRVFFTRNRKMAIAFLTGFRKILNALAAPEKLVKQTDAVIKKISD